MIWRIAYAFVRLVLIGASAAVGYISVYIPLMTLEMLSFDRRYPLLFLLIYFLSIMAGTILAGICVLLLPHWRSNATWDKPTSKPFIAVFSIFGVVAVGLFFAFFNKAGFLWLHSADQLNAPFTIWVHIIVYFSWGAAVGGVTGVMVGKSLYSFIWRTQHRYNA